MKKISETIFETRTEAEAFAKKIRDQGKFCRVTNRYKKGHYSHHKKPEKIWIVREYEK